SAPRDQTITMARGYSSQKQRRGRRQRVRRSQADLALNTSDASTSLASVLARLLAGSHRLSNTQLRRAAADGGHGAPGHSRAAERRQGGTDGGEERQVGGRGRRDGSAGPDGVERGRRVRGEPAHDQERRRERRRAAAARVAVDEHLAVRGGELSEQAKHRA